MLTTTAVILNLMILSNNHHGCHAYQLNNRQHQQQQQQRQRQHLVTTTASRSSKFFNTNDDDDNPHHSISYNNNNRRKLLVGGLASGLATLSFQPQQAQAVAVSFFDNKEDRRQLELCIVTILRLQYWATNVVSKLQQQEQSDDGGGSSDELLLLLLEVDDESVREKKKRAAYLEARLGAKVAVTGKIGGGANGNVYMLGSLQIKDCFRDLQYYGKTSTTTRTKSSSPQRVVVEDLIVDIIESLASIVEFDGLETTQDPSPRSSLTLSMYTDSKATYVTRMLQERVIPLTQELVDVFGQDVKDRCKDYILQYYPNEIPPIPPTSPEEKVMGTPPPKTGTNNATEVVV